MPILGITASSISGNLITNSYVSISTVTVGSGGSATVTFSSIPATYKHLQIRYIARGTRASNYIDISTRYNSDTGNNYYSLHQLYGDGSSAASDVDSTASLIKSGYSAAANQSASIFGTGVIDILDYSNTNKYKTQRSLIGIDNNGSGYIMLRSGLWMSTSAISNISFFPDGGNFAEYTQFALYGIKGA
jgi:hypothetical protein